MSTITDSLTAATLESSTAAIVRIHELETALNRMIHAHENLASSTDGEYPPLDYGCIECSSGCVPDKYNNGPCAYHNAKKLLGQL